MLLLSHCIKQITEKICQAQRKYKRRLLSGVDLVHKYWWSYPTRGSPGSSKSKKSSCSAGDSSLIPGPGRSPGEGNGNPLQYSCLENPKDRGAKWAIQSMGLQRVRHDWATNTYLTRKSSVFKVVLNDMFGAIDLKQNWFDTFSTADYHFPIIFVLDTTFVGFKNVCSGETNVIFITNPLNEDLQHPIHVKNIQLVDTTEQSKIFIHRPDLR